MNINYILLIILSIIVLFLLLRFLSSSYPIIPFGKNKVPKEYKNYQHITSGVETDLYKMEPLKGVIIEYFNEKDHSVVVRTANAFYKLNTDGEIVDSLTLESRQRNTEHEGYLINDEYYYTWMLNGDKSKHPIKIINRDLALSREAFKEKFISLYNSASLAKIIFYDEIYTQIFLIDNKWVMLYGNKLLYSEEQNLDEDGKPIHYFGEKEILPEKHIKRNSTYPISIQDSEVWDGKNKYVNLVHFQKLSYKKKRKSGGLNPVSWSFPAMWEGEGYLHLNYKNDIIPFKVDLNLIDRDGRYEFHRLPFNSSVRYFTTDDLNYGLFSDRIGHRLYKIKAK